MFLLPINIQSTAPSVVRLTALVDVSDVVDSCAKARYPPAVRTMLVQATVVAATMLVELMIASVADVPTVPSTTAVALSLFRHLKNVAVPVAGALVSDVMAFAVFVTTLPAAAAAANAVAFRGK